LCLSFPEKNIATILIAVQALNEKLSMTYRVEENALWRGIFKP
jgi:hypothetical protein